ncbi:MAG: PspC domain-containing protein, partial [Chitinophagales bacterium]|nr:PspC domain-containing protein [Chitinophagales bacterium]
MNKTVTINLSGIVFHIDDNAFEVLKRYLDNLKSHFANVQGKEEIIADIESRMAEMFSEKVGPSKDVIMIKDVQEVIDIMGRPEQVAGDEEKAAPENKTADAGYYYEGMKKRFFRNPDDKVLGGVSSGIAAYFDVDPLWIRLAFVIMVLAGFSGILIYIILWIIIPEANTAAEKLQMRGERVTVA